MKLFLWTPFLLLAWAKEKEAPCHFRKHYRNGHCPNQCVWTVLGQEIQGSQDGENVGVSVSLSMSEYVLAIGAKQYN